MIERNQLIYIEHKSGHAHSGPAWITRAQVSKSRKTIYFNRRALKRLGGQGISGNYYCLETGDEFWVSGVKVTGGDRHWAGNGPVMVDKRVLESYLVHRGLMTLDPSVYKVDSNLKDTDVSRFHDLENVPL
ncbi:MAG: hypothetical protein P1U82_30210 [Verrucomicrobiales bacterium]|nr:hypothetical protein [Verrucomicrobiales bacterium]